MGAYGRSPYCATKFGVEAISDCLRMEMKKFNVDVSEKLFWFYCRAHFLNLNLIISGGSH